MWAQDNPENVPNATKYDGRANNTGVMWERVLTDGFIHVYSGAHQWRWYVECTKTRLKSISAQIYEGPKAAMDAGQMVFDLLLQGDTERPKLIGALGLTSAR